MPIRYCSAAPRSDIDHVGLQPADVVGLELGGDGSHRLPFARRTAATLILLKRRVDDRVIADGAVEYQHLWTFERVKAFITDPDAIYINNRHPRALDEAVDAGGVRMPDRAARTRS